jgi:hypothetical protein
MLTRACALVFAMAGLFVTFASPPAHGQSSPMPIGTVSGVTPIESHMENNCQLPQ